MRDKHIKIAIIQLCILIQTTALGFVIVSPDNLDPKTFLIDYAPAQSTTINFNGQFANNIPIPVDFGSNISISSPIATVTNGGAPNISIDWKAPDSISGSHNGFNGWQFYDWEFTTGKSAAVQVDFTAAESPNFKAGDSFLEVTLSPQTGYYVILDSFDLGTWKKYGDVTLKWLAYSTTPDQPLKQEKLLLYDEAAKGDMYKTVKVGLKSPEPLTIRLILEKESGLDNLALDNLKIGQEKIKDRTGSTTVTFTGADNENLPDNFASKAASSTTGVKVEKSGTPKIECKWQRGSLSKNNNEFAGWQSYSWDDSNEKSHVVQCDFSDHKTGDSFLELLLKADEGHQVSLEGFELKLWPGYPQKVEWQILGTKTDKPLQSGLTTLDDKNFSEKILQKLNILGPEIRVRLFHQEGDPTGLALDNLKFSQY